MLSRQQESHTKRYPLKLIWCIKASHNFCLHGTPCQLHLTIILQNQASCCPEKTNLKNTCHKAARFMQELLWSAFQNKKRFQHWCVPAWRMQTSLCRTHNNTSSYTHTTSAPSHDACDLITPLTTQRKVVLIQRFFHMHDPCCHDHPVHNTDQIYTLKQIQ